MYERDRVRDRDYVERQVERAPWSPAQLVALVVGTVFIIFGAVALARTGVHSSGQFLHEHTQVGGFHHTPLLGAVELGFGLLMVLAGAVPGAYRSLMTFLGVIALGFGIVVLIQPTSFHRYLGVHSANGWLYLFTGIVSLLTAMVSPVIFGRDRTAATRHYEMADSAVDLREGVVDERPAGRRVLTRR